MTPEYLRSWALDDIVIRSGGDGRTVEAYAAMFDTPYEVRDQHGHYMEVIDRAAFNRTLKNGAASRVACLYNHGMTVHGKADGLLSVPLGTPLEIKPDGRGLLTVTRYNRSELADATLEAIRNGDIRSQSFRGRIFRSTPTRLPRTVSRSGPLPTVTRHELGLSDYGPTPIPVNADAKILAVRSMAQLDDDERQALIDELLRHYPGRHRQSKHGNRYGRTLGGKRGALLREGKSKLDDDFNDDDKPTSKPTSKGGGSSAGGSSTSKAGGSKGGGSSAGSAGGASESGPKRLADDTHAALGKLGEQAAQHQREGRVYPLLADKLGLSPDQINRLERRGLIVRDHGNMLGKAVKITNEGHDYLMHDRGTADHDAKLRKVQEAAEAEAAQHFAAADDYRQKAHKNRDNFAAMYAKHADQEGRAAEVRAEQARRERVKLQGGEAPSSADRAEADRIAAEQVARETEKAEREAADAAAAAEREADAADWAEIKDRVSAEFDGLLADHDKAKNAARREVRKAHGLPSLADAKRMQKSGDREERARGFAAEGVYHAAAQLAGFRTAEDNNRRQVEAAERELAKGLARPANAERLQEGIDRINGTLPGNRDAIASGERELTAKVAEWEAGKGTPLTERDQIGERQRQWREDLDAGLLPQKNAQGETTYATTGGGRITQAEAGRIMHGTRDPGGNDLVVPRDGVPSGLDRVRERQRREAEAAGKATPEDRAEYQRVQDARERAGERRQLAERERARRDAEAAAAAAPREFTRKDALAALDGKRGRVGEHMETLQAAGASHDQAVKILRDLYIKVDDNPNAGRDGGWTSNDVEYADFGHNGDQGRTLRRQIDGDQQAEAEAKRQQNLRDATPAAYARLLGEDGQPALTTSKPVRAVIEAMRDRGWTVTNADRWGGTRWSSPDGESHLRLSTFNGQPKLSDDRSNAISGKKALEQVTGGSAPAATSQPVTVKGIERPAESRRDQLAAEAKPAGNDRRDGTPSAAASARVAAAAAKSDAEYAAELKDQQAAHKLRVRAAKAVADRQYTGRPGDGWHVRGDDVLKTPTRVGVTTDTRVRIYPSDNGRRFEVHTYDHQGEQVGEPRAFAKLDDAFRFGDEVTENGHAAALAPAKPARAAAAPAAPEGPHVRKGEDGRWRVYGHGPEAEADGFRNRKAAEQSLAELDAQEAEAAEFAATAETRMREVRERIERERIAEQDKALTDLEAARERVGSTDLQTVDDAEALVRRLAPLGLSPNLLVHDGMFDLSFYRPNGDRVASFSGPPGRPYGGWKLRGLSITDPDWLALWLASPTGTDEYKIGRTLEKAAQARQRPVVARSRAVTVDLFGDITATPVGTGLGAEDSATGHSGRLSIRRARLRAEMTKRGIR